MPSAVMRSGPIIAPLVLLAYVPLGYVLSWADYTYGYKGLDPAHLVAAPAWFAAWVLGALVFEAVFRGLLLRALHRRLMVIPSVLLHLLVINVVLGKFWYGLGAGWDTLGVGRVFLYENSLQLVWTVLYLRSRSFWVSGLAHGAYAGFRFVVISDVAGPIETLFFYTSSHPVFYVLMFALPFLVIFMVQWRVSAGERRTRSRGSANARDISRQAAIMGAILYVFAAWTLLIKFVIPILYALWQGEPLSTYIWKDAWWIAHLLVGYGLRNRVWPIWSWAVFLAAVETIIIGVKFALFLPDPGWDFWTTNWFINKSAMLAYFVCSLVWLSRSTTREHLM